MQGQAENKLMNSLLSVFTDRFRRYGRFLLVALPALSACGPSGEWSDFANHAAQPLALSSVSDDMIMSGEPIRALQAVDPSVSSSPIVQLGRQLFHDRRLSADGSVSCASCHDLSAGGDDDRVASIGIRGQVGTINAPTVLNSGHSFRQFWDGRAQTLAQQAEGPITNPLEMGADWPTVLATLSSDQALLDLFEESFHTRDVTPLRVTEAIAAFERTLVTPGPFDRYLNGDVHAISDAAQKGYALFKEYGCAACHQGVNIGGNLMQYFGAFHSVDMGAIASAREQELPLYKVPTLRNIEKTAPYFHTGSVMNLDDAVRVMAAAQLGRVTSDQEAALLVAFLESLSGDVPGHATALSQNGFSR